MTDTQEIIVGESQTQQTSAPNIAPIYAKCLSCTDFGTSCRGFDLLSLEDVSSVRAYHRALKKAYGFSLKAVAAEAKILSEYTVNEYFSNVVKNDYKWTTVVTINNAIISICGHRAGLPPLDHSCPAAASEYRNLLSAADIKLAAADLNLANMQAECDDLRRRLSNSDGSHISQIANIQASNRSEVDWLKNDVRLWRRFAFLLLGVGIILLACLVFYIAWDVAHPASGLIRY